MPYKDKEKQRTFQRNWKLRKAEKLRQLKVNKPCTDCHNSFHPVAMQWDHLGNKPKFLEISKMAQYTWKRILKEIEKCDLVCANCHAIRSYNRTMEKIRYR